LIDLFSLFNPWETIQHGHPPDPPLQKHCSHEGLFDLSYLRQVMASVGKMRTALPAVAMLRGNFIYCVVPNRLQGRRISFLLLFSEESRPHFHVSHPDGEAKFWLSPTVELARNIGLSSSRVKEAERLATSRQQEIIDAWNNHFKS
jgi:hypothetical protein